MQKNKWQKISVKTTLVLADAISDYLVGLGAGVETKVDDDQDYLIVNGFLEKEAGAKCEQIVKNLQIYIADLADIFSVKIPIITTEIIKDEDWSKNWKQHFTPFSVIPGLVIAPSWEEYIQQDNEKIIEMDPGMAFGTGHHGTTSLTLSLMDEVLREKPVISTLDVGCGTGVLAMFAALSGVKEVLAIDNDPDAVAATNDNIRKNNLESIVKASSVPLSEIKETFSLVVTNIIHNVLLDLSDDLWRVTETGGSIVLSGILVGEQTESIINAFSKKGYKLLKQTDDQEWSALLFRK